jgi:rhodanese-related sulfurtransferase
MRVLSAILSVMLSASAATACALPPQQPADPFAAVPRMSVTELKRLLGEGRVVIVDVRAAEAYDEGRLRGAVSMPLEDVVARAKELPRDKMIVTYCDCPGEHSGSRAAVFIKHQGFEQVAVLTGGWDAWKEAGMTVEAPRADGDADGDAHSQEGRVAQGGGRVAPARGLECDRNELTLYDGLVTVYRRRKGSTFLRISTNFDTTEEVTIRHPGTDDPSRFYLLNGEPFKSSDWRLIERRKGVLRAGMRANVWVCRDNPSVQPVADWRPDDTGANPRSR